MSSQAPSGLRRTVAPTFPAIDVASLKGHGEIVHNDDNAILADYIEAATDYAERVQERCLRLSTWQAVYDCFPSSGVFYVPMPRLVAVTSIAYVASGGTNTTLATSYYTVDAISEPGRVALAYGQTWPQTRDQIAAVTMTYTAGYASAALIPARTRQAIRMLAAHWYENREAVVVGESVANVPLSVNDLLNEDRLVSYR